MAFAACCGLRETPATAKRFPERNSATLEGILAIATPSSQSPPFGSGLQPHRQPITRTTKVAANTDEARRYNEAERQAHKAASAPEESCQRKSPFSNGPRTAFRTSNRAHPDWMPPASSGVTMKDFYMVTGQYDMIAISEAADEGVMAGALLSITSKGDFTSETCRAFTEQEYRQIIGDLP